MAFVQKELIRFNKYASLIDITKMHEAAAFSVHECRPAGSVGLWQSYRKKLAFDDLRVSVN